MSSIPDEIATAARVLARGGVVAFPTETVYGLGADAWNESAVRRIFTIKGRPPDRALIVHLAEREDMDAFASHVPRVARRLARAFWPGPLTLVLPKADRVSDVVTGGGGTVGLRVPDHDIARSMIRGVGRFTGRTPGIAAPSANRFGEPPPLTAEDVRIALGDGPDVVLDGGPCPLTVPSTVLDVTVEPPVVVRLGATAVADIERVLGYPLTLG